MIMNSIASHIFHDERVSPGMTLLSSTYDSPVGTLTLVAAPAGLKAIAWPDRDWRHVGLDSADVEPGSSPFLDQTERELDEYFAGDRTSFDVPLELEGTDFQLAAWRALAAIPYGETRSYAEQATRIGRPSAVRAVGAANGRNPVSIVLPCHRVVGSDGALRGFGGGLDVKEWLLRHEAANARSRAPSSKRASPEEPASPARAGRNRGTWEGVLSAASFRT
jgi:methylated-DNA-[protein]-cysteine S-methyltransferase